MTRELPSSLLMLISSRHAEVRILDAVRAAGFEDLTLAQGRVTAGIDPEGTRLSVLAERAGVAKQTATALVDRLERAGYVERTPDPLDGRARLVRLTAKGRSAIPVARAEEARIEKEWEQHLGARRMQQLRDALALLREITDPWYEPDAAHGAPEAAAR